MASRIVAWDRLIRYIAQDNSHRYGEPIVPENKTEHISALADQGVLQVKVFRGGNPLTAQPTDEVETVKRLLGPLTAENVSIIRCVGLNYKSHILEGGRNLPVNPTIFMKPGMAIADWGEAITIPKFAQEQCDYEGELTIIIGKDGKDIQVEDALDHVAAYTCGNDITARDWQRDPAKAGPVPQWCFAKSFDKYAPMGPCLVAAHLLGSADDLDLRTFVNGEERQHGNTRDLCFGVKELVAFCSRSDTAGRHYYHDWYPRRRRGFYEATTIPQRWGRSCGGDLWNRKIEKCY